MQPEFRELPGHYQIKLIDVPHYHTKPILITCAWPEGRKFKGQWFLVIPTPQEELLTTTEESRPNESLDSFMDRLEFLGMKSITNIEGERFRKAQLEEAFIDPQAIAATLDDLEQPWRRGQVNKLRDVCNTMCPILLLHIVELTNKPRAK